MLYLHTVNSLYTVPYVNIVTPSCTALHPAIFISWFQSSCEVERICGTYLLFPRASTITNMSKKLATTSWTTSNGHRNRVQQICRRQWTMTKLVISRLLLSKHVSSWKCDARTVNKTMLMWCDNNWCVDISIVHSLMVQSHKHEYF